MLIIILFWDQLVIILENRFFSSSSFSKALNLSSIPSFEDFGSKVLGRQFFTDKDGQYLIK